MYIPTMPAINLSMYMVKCVFVFLEPTGCFYNLCSLTFS